jgi:hypothetical protein
MKLGEMMVLEGSSPSYDSLTIEAIVVLSTAGLGRNHHLGFVGLGRIEGVDQ